MEGVVKRLPKIELHAHLNGSIPPALIAELLEEKRRVNPALADCEFDPNGDRTLKECFSLFSLIHTLVCDAATLHRVTCAVIRAFAADNLAYLELRTTPRSIPEAGLTEQGYLDTVLDAISTTIEKDCLDMEVRVLLSINRAESVEKAQSTVALALLYRTRGVVGVELSGNPTVGNFADFVGALTTARDHGLPVSIHFAETDNYAESESILDFGPQRLGHAAFLNNSLLQRLHQLQIPVECCPTSNVKSNSCVSYEDHVFRYLHRLCPLTICTDDTGVFNTTLSQEWLLIAQAHRLTLADIQALSMDAVECVFDDRVKPLLLRRCEEFWASESSRQHPNKH